MSLCFNWSPVVRESRCKMTPACYTDGLLKRNTWITALNCVSKETAEQQFWLYVKEHSFVRKHGQLVQLR